MRKMILLLMMILLCPVTARADTIVTIYAVGDTYLASDFPNTNYKTVDDLRIGMLSRTMIKFNNTSILNAISNMTLVSATLGLYLNENDNNWGTGQNVDVHRMTVNWQPGSTTYNCRVDTNIWNQIADCDPQWSGGTFNSTPTDTVLHSNGEIDIFKEFDVTDDVSLFASGTSNYGWMIKRTNEGVQGSGMYASVELGIREPNLRPYLKLILSEPYITPIDDDINLPNTIPPTGIPTATPTFTAKNSATVTKTKTPLPTRTITRTPTRTGTITRTPTITKTRTMTPTNTPDLMLTPVPAHINFGGISQPRINSRLKRPRLKRPDVYHPRPDLNIVE